ncbi:MAG: prepilin peptidase [Rickettsiales bacterium]|nr:prepilin peptidase [Rickettsiales bacterium]
MFDAIQGMRIDWVLDGIILSIVFGFAAGNYACSLVFRLPRGRLILDKTPYCGTCGTPLQVKDLFPVISALLLKHKCRYCKTPFPVSHTWTEILVGLLFVLAFFKYNFSEQYILVVLIGIFLITQAAIEANEKMVMRSVMICVVVCGMIFRTLQDHTTFPMIQGGLLSLVMGCMIWRKDIKQVGHWHVELCLGAAR